MSQEEFTAAVEQFLSSGRPVLPTTRKWEEFPKAEVAALEQALHDHEGEDMSGKVKWGSFECDGDDFILFLVLLLGALIAIGSFILVLVGKFDHEPHEQPPVVIEAPK